MEALNRILADMPQKYPRAALRDYIKLIYQNEFGCGHLIADADSFRRQLAEEAAMARPGRYAVEPIGNGYVRVYLQNACALGLSCETIAAMALCSAETAHGTQEGFRVKLSLLPQLCAAGTLPFSVSDCRTQLDAYQKAGCLPPHHSERYRAAYAPAYRVAGAYEAQHLALFAAIDRALAATAGPVLVGIDGPCASGKTTLAEQIRQCYDCNVFHADDFFLRSEQRTPERLNTPGGNMDRERLEQEVLRPLREGKSVLYRPYSCKTQSIAPGSTIPFRRLNIIEGSYALHPELRRYYALKAVLCVPANTQWQRLARRESAASLERFRTRWIPLEQSYSVHTGLLSCADLIFA